MLLLPFAFQLARFSLEFCPVLTRTYQRSLFRAPLRHQGLELLAFLLQAGRCSVGLRQCLILELSGDFSIAPLNFTGRRFPLGSQSDFLFSIGISQGFRPLFFLAHSSPCRCQLGVEGLDLGFHRLFDLCALALLQLDCQCQCQFFRLDHVGQLFLYRFLPFLFQASLKPQQFNLLLLLEGRC